jgi:predicted Zn-dependent protease
MKSTATLLLILAGSVFAQQPTAQGVNFYSLDREIALGRQAAAGFAGERVGDPALNAYLAKLGASIAKSADPRFRYTFAFYDDRKPFAVPGPPLALPADAEVDRSEPIAIAGGPIFVPLSLLADAASEAAFAFQLAHAVAHVALRHATRLATRAAVMEIGAAAAAQVEVDGALTRVALREGARLATPLARMQFARGFEKQADSLAVSLADAAGYDPLAVVPSLEGRVESESRTFSAHPSGSARAEVVRDAAGKLPVRDSSADTGAFLAMKVLAAGR